MSQQYSPLEHEPEIYQKWEASGAFLPSAKAEKSFVIMLPPPNITGVLHMGHALQDTIIDTLIRYHRMKGEKTLWVPGTDHAAIATNKVIEKQLQDEGTTRQKLGREKFLQRTEEWYEKMGNQIIEQMKRLGSSADWSRQRFTLDDAYYQAVLTAFVRYHEAGYIYRGNRLVNWCPRCQSVISDLEIAYEDRDGELTTIQYPLSDDSGTIDVATTRPETMLGDTAVAVHPADERYQALVGKTIKLPLSGREIPIITDERIDAAFGTGAVKVTPAHDPLDAAIGETHKLPAIAVIGEDGLMTNAAGEFAGLSVAEARKAVRKRLQAEGHIVAQQSHKHSVATCDRCGTVIEPLLSRQWFVAMDKLKDKALAAAEENAISFIPERWRQHYLDWMNQVHDWTISRQLWLGHRIPVWWKPGTRLRQGSGGQARGTEDEAGNYIVAIEKPEGDWEQDPDVLDTWFSSALWPFAALGWPKETKDLDEFYPTSALVTGRDILYLWVARMIFSSLELTGKIPFKDVVIHPTVLTKTGQRMSKSLGTGVDPLELIEKYGADATRFGLLRQLHYDSQALRFDEQALVAARNFANKLWNIARLLEKLPERAEETIADRWIVSRATQTQERITELLEAYKIGEAAQELHAFIWDDFADWYMEILKTEGSTEVAGRVWKQILIMAHPFLPFITEVLWQQQGNEGLLISEAWDAARAAEDKKAEESLQLFRDIVNTVRSARVLLGLPAGATVTLWAPAHELAQALPALARAEVVEELLPTMQQFPLQGGGTIGIASEHITPDSLEQARARLDKEIAAAKQTALHTEKLLQQMRGKAAEEVVAEKEEILAQAQARLAELQRSQGLLT
jgi:valyl-tRNA synthetase